MQAQLTIEQQLAALQERLDVLEKKEQETRHFLLRNMSGFADPIFVPQENKELMQVRVYASLKNAPSIPSWYMLNQEMQPKPCPSDSITGILSRVGFSACERRNKETPKLHVLMRTERVVYCIEAGADTGFCKSFLTQCDRLGQLNNGRIKHLIVNLAVKPNRDGTGLFARLNYLNPNELKWRRVVANWDNETFQFDPVVERVLSLFH